MKILRSMAIIGIVGTMAVSATGAYFTDQKSIAGNTFATGTLRLTLNHPSGKPFRVQAAYPGYQTGWEYMDVFNGPYPAQPGQLPFEAYLWLSRTSGSSSLYEALNIDLYDSGWDSICGNGDDVLIYSGSLVGINGQAHRIQTSDKDPNAQGTPGNDDIRPGWSQRICQRLTLPTSVDNSLQGKEVVFTEWVDAEQNND